MTNRFKAPKRPVSRVFIHCSASDNPDHDDVKVIRKWHVQDRKWADIGYHFFINKAGMVQPGRDLERTPAAQAGHNTGTIAICVGGHHMFSTQQFDALKELCDQIHDALPLVTFHGHREVEPRKECPVFDYKKVLGLDSKGRLT